jgi:SAM-dependent methyltransferase
MCQGTVRSEHAAQRGRDPRPVHPVDRTPPTRARPDHLLQDPGVLLRSWLCRAVRCLAVAVVDEEFRHPLLAALYDALDPVRGDLQPYVDLVAELGAHRVLDVGCGTGELALMLAAAGCDVVAADPAAASLAVARAKPDAERVRWIDGDATSVSVTDRDIALLTGNTAQAITDSEQWTLTLEAIHACLRPGGHLAFETRDPAGRAWEQWTPAATHQVIGIPGTGRVERWIEVTEFDWPLVTICWTWVLARDEATLTSSSTLRFRERSEVVDDLNASGFDVVDVPGVAPRPGQELVFLARRRDRARQRAGSALA